MDHAYMNLTSIGSINFGGLTFKMSTYLVHNLVDTMNSIILCEAIQWIYLLWGDMEEYHKSDCFGT